MKADPILRDWKQFKGDGASRRIRVHGGLHYIRGNRAPHFSVTADIQRAVGSGWHDDGGGAAHEEILRHHPDLADIISLHLGDMDGAPMYAEANGWYWMAGALGGAGERYHGGNSMQNFPITPPAGKLWPTTEHRNPTPDEALAIFARHARVSMAAAINLRSAIRAELGPIQEYEGAPEHRPSDYKRARARFAKWIEEQRPRWKAEADAVIAKYGLKPYGDHWEAK